MKQFIVFWVLSLSTISSFATSISFDDGQEIKLIYSRYNGHWFEGYTLFDVIQEVNLAGQQTIKIPSNAYVMTFEEDTHNTRDRQQIIGIPSIGELFIEMGDSWFFCTSASHLNLTHFPNMAMAFKINSQFRSCEIDLDYDNRIIVNGVQIPIRQSRYSWRPAIYYYSNGNMAAIYTGEQSQYQIELPGQYESNYHLFGSIGFHENGKIESFMLGKKAKMYRSDGTIIKVPARSYVDLDEDGKILRHSSI